MNLISCKNAAHSYPMKHEANAIYDICIEWEAMRESTTTIWGKPIYWIPL